MMKFYLINLERNADRLSRMNSRLCELGINYERVSAIDGRALSDSDIAGKCNLVRMHLAMARSLNKGEIGCALSHLEVYRRMVEANAESAVVMEDDVDISDGIHDGIAHIRSQIDVSQPAVVLMSALCIVNTTRDFVGLESLKNASGTDLYFITLPAAKAILHANSPVITVSDQWRRWVGNGIIKLYRYWPIIAHQNRAMFGSEISLAINKRNIFSKLFCKMAQVIGRLIDSVLIIILGK